MGLQDTDLDVLVDIGEILGASALEEQCMLLEARRRDLEQRLEDAREQHRTKGRMYRTFGVLGGAAVVLMLL